MHKCILFTDIKGSSLLWQKHGKKMFIALKKHNEQINHMAKKYKGTIIKMIGDAFMISFDSIEDVLHFAYNMCIAQVKSPVKVKGNDCILIRMGICCGEVNVNKVSIQNKKLIDYFGATVNIASRMESKVSEVGGFAVSIQGMKKPNKEIMDILNKLPHLKYSFSYYTYQKCSEIKRSMRLLSNQQNNIVCHDPEQLKGVGAILAYSCRVNL